MIGRNHPAVGCIFSAIIQALNRETFPAGLDLIWAWFSWVESKVLQSLKVRTLRSIWIRWTWLDCLNGSFRNWFGTPFYFITCVNNFKINLATFRPSNWWPIPSNWTHFINPWPPLTRVFWKNSLLNILDMEQMLKNELREKMIRDSMQRIEKIICHKRPISFMVVFPCKCFDKKMTFYLRKIHNDYSKVHKENKFT